MVYCTKCGYESKSGKKFCVKCGNKIISSEKTQPQKKENSNEPLNRNQEIKSRSHHLKITLIILAFLIALGGLGYYWYLTDLDRLACISNLSTTEGDLANAQSQREALRTEGENVKKQLADLQTNNTLISNQLQTCHDELNSSQIELNRAQLGLQSTQELTALKNKYKQDYQDELNINNNLQEENAVLTSQKMQLESSVLSYRSKVGVIQSCVDSFLSDYDAGLTSSMKSDLDDCLD